MQNEQTGLILLGFVLPGSLDSLLERGKSLHVYIQLCFAICIWGVCWVCVPVIMQERRHMGHDGFLVFSSQWDRSMAQFRCIRGSLGDISLTAIPIFEIACVKSITRPVGTITWITYRRWIATNNVAIVYSGYFILVLNVRIGPRSTPQD